MKMSRKKTAVIAIGGNSLIKDNAHQKIEDQYQAAKETCYHIADMIEAGWNVAIGHGNGPQVGLILRQSEVAAKVEHLPETPLDVCGAESQGLIGYLLQQNLQNELFRRKIHQNVATVITQVLVDKNDPAFQHPTKPIGGFMTEEEAKRKAEELGWTVVEDAGRGWRRVVASPDPKEVVELDTIKALIEAGVIVITVGGGGIPVIDKGDGDYVGIAAVIDKDFASSLLAQEINADIFIISTAVEKVALNYGKPNEKLIDRMTVAEAKQYIQEGHFAKGSMLPKVQACIRYLEAGGKEALITSPENIGRALRGETGTWIVP
ncbi:carbamate kinase [Anaerolinea thermophila UNI-1]|uniref:Carbamate kinase n=2 Tax=Anaerolineaceae TaxID=292628 RepID=E8MZ17_ANATU|nr:carbamate kinase [Anaerolinea thermophila UNI-1]